MIHRLTGYQGLDACDLTLTHNIQLARCKFDTVGTFHTAMVTILYCMVRSGPFQKACRERDCIHTGQGYRNKPSEPFQNRFKIRVVWKSEPEIGPFRKRIIPFRYEHKRQVCSGPLSGLAGFLRVHANAFHLLSPSILEKLFFPAGVIFYF